MSVLTRKLAAEIIKNLDWIEHYAKGGDIEWWYEPCEYSKSRGEKGRWVIVDGSHVFNRINTSHLGNTRIRKKGNTYSCPQKGCPVWKENNIQNEAT